jgi:hypothetical protein
MTRIGRREIMLERPTVQRLEQGCQKHPRYETKVKSEVIYTGDTFLCKNQFGQDSQFTNVFQRYTNRSLLTDRRIRYIMERLIGEIRK